MTKELKIIFVFVVLLAIVMFLRQEPIEEKDFHIHADVAVYIHGERFDLSLDEYQSNADKQLHRSFHLHDNDGDVIHQLEKGLSLGNFFSSVGVLFTKACIVVEDANYCSDDYYSLQMFVNGEPNDAFDDYQFNDVDQILITYGSSEETIKRQVDLVTDKACIPSGLCPERGVPSEEGCGVGETCPAVVSYDTYNENDEEN